jgi:hypothetical protein
MQNFLDIGLKMLNLCKHISNMCLKNESLVFFAAAGYMKEI